jgi:hypothetical protein
MTSSLPVHAPAVHAYRLQYLLNQLALRGLGNQMTMACVLPMRTDFQTWEELFAIQAAVWQRLQQQHADWVAGCNAMVQEYSQLKRANTLSKFVEQEYNVFAQMGALMSAQAASFSGLLENLQVDMGYWVAQKRAAMA